MFITSSNRWYARDGQQRVAGVFLLLCQPDKPAAALEHSCPWTIFGDLSHPEGRRCDTATKLWPAEHWWCPSCGRASISRIYLPKWGDIRCFVKRVKMFQAGHWMVGTMEIGRFTVSLSGSYGADGLPRTVPRELWERGVPLPEDLRTALNEGGGHNTCGKEAPLMLDWALENMKALRKASRSPSLSPGRAHREGNRGRGLAVVGRRRSSL